MGKDLQKVKLKDKLKLLLSIRIIRSIIRENRFIIKDLDSKKLQKYTQVKDLLIKVVTLKLENKYYKEQLK